MPADHQDARRREPSRGSIGRTSRIALVSPSLEPGKCGVGDYVRQLCTALERRGCAVIAVGFSEDSADAGDSQMLRLDSSLPFGERSRRFLETVRRFQPDWISWHVSAYGYAPRGMLLREAAVAAESRKLARTHAFLHELWIGLSDRDSLTDRLQGFLQRCLLLRFLSRLAPARMHTSNDGYALVLRHAGWNAGLMPVFPSIPVAQAGLEEVSRARGRLGLDAAGARLVGGIFGTIHEGWDPMKAFGLLEREAAKRGVDPLMVGLGRLGPYGDAWFRERAGDTRIVRIGRVEDRELSVLMRLCDVAFASTPVALARKSSSIANWNAHGVPVALTEDTWSAAGSFRGGALPEGVLHVGENGELPALPRLPLRSGEEEADAAAKAFLTELSQAR